MSNTQQSKVSINQIEPGTIINVKGTITFSRLSKVVEGAELEKANRQREKYSQIPITSPYVQVVLKDPEIIDNGKTPQVAKDYISQKMYKKADDSAGSKFLNLITKTSFVPDIYLVNQQTHKGERVTLSGEPSDQPAIVSLRVYGTRKGNNGLGISSVALIGDSVQYYNNSKSALEDLGFEILDKPKVEVRLQEETVFDDLPDDLEAEADDILSNINLSLE